MLEYFCWSCLSPISSLNLSIRAIISATDSSYLGSLLSGTFSFLCWPPKWGLSLGPPSPPIMASVILIMFKISYGMSSSSSSSSSVGGGPIGPLRIIPGPLPGPDIIGPLILIEGPGPPIISYIIVFIIPPGPLRIGPEDKPAPPSVVILTDLNPGPS